MIETEEFGQRVLRPKREALGLTQQEVAKSIGVHQSQIYRVEVQGQKPKDITALHRWIKVYQLTKHEADEWLELLHGNAPKYSISPYDIEFAESQIKVIRKIRVEGNPQLAEQMANYLDHWLEEKERTSSAVELQYVRKLQGMTLLEKAIGYKDFLPKTEVFKIGEPILNEVRKIGKECYNTELIGLAELQLGQLYYIIEDYGNSIKYLKKALDLVKSPDNKLITIGTLAINLAYLGEEKETKACAKQVNDLLDNNHYSDIPNICDALQSLARAQGILKLAEAQYTLEKLQNFSVMKNNLGQKSPIRDVQLARSQVEILSRFESNNVWLLEKIGMEGIRLASTHGFSRHENILKNFLQLILD